MIRPEELQERDRGRKVIYTNGVGETEEGVLSSWNERTIWVRFKGPSGESCRFEDIAFSFAKEANRA